MKRLLTLTILAGTLFMFQPVRAQQQDDQKGGMEMMNDSTMMQKMMDNPEMHKKMMRKMRKKMHGDSTMPGMQGMMDGKVSDMCMKMCMHMMHNMETDNHQEHMHEDENNAKRKKSES